MSLVCQPSNGVPARRAPTPACPPVVHGVGHELHHLARRVLGVVERVGGEGLRWGERETFEKT